MTDLASTNVSKVMDDKITADNVTDTATYSVVFSGTGASTTVQMGKIGDIYVKTDDGNIYIAKGTTPASDWVLVKN